MVYAATPEHESPTASAGRPATNPQADLYFDLLGKALTAYLYDESGWQMVDRPWAGHRNLLHKASAIVKRSVWHALRRRGLVAVRPSKLDLARRTQGTDWPIFGYSMLGLVRLANIRQCVEQVLRDGTPGDLVETGVWRGGGTIFMRALLRFHNASDRVVWAADSFEGLPPPNPGASGLSDETDYSRESILKVSLEQVKSNFERFGLLDDGVRFLKGWFKDTLPGAPIEKIAVLRLDGDLYESTMDALTALYARVSPGGFVIVDDYHGWPGCRKAVDEFRSRHGISSPLVGVDWTAVMWQVP